jgi:hypothetical protein
MMAEARHSTGFRFTVHNEHIPNTDFLQFDRRREPRGTAAGDVVKNKKPDPEIYNLALTKLNLKPEEVFVVEDSKNGVKASKAAGIKTVVTTNGYTEKEDLEAGDVIVSCLGDPGGDKTKMHNGNLAGFDGVVHVKDVVAAFSK